jgi:hypothetical protein
MVLSVTLLNVELGCYNFIFIYKAVTVTVNAKNEKRIELDFFIRSLSKSQTEISFDFSWPLSKIYIFCGKI